LILTTLFTGIRCSGTVSGERERLTWEALLLTPLSVKQLIRGKLWGIIGAVYLYLVAYAIPALALSVLGNFGSVFWVVLLLATTLLAIYFLGAAGLRCSVRAKTSWRSLLGTLGIGYVGGAIAFVVVSPVLFIIAFFIWFAVQLIDKWAEMQTGTSVFGGVGFSQFWFSFFIATCIGLALCCWGLAWFFLADAQKWVADRERTRHWHEEPLDYGYRRRRRRPRLRSASR
jgi:ABC-type transport system involved in multi-copper enzyme maturation permease subunit